MGLRVAGIPGDDLAQTHFGLGPATRGGQVHGAAMFAVDQFGQVLHTLRRSCEFLATSAATIPLRRSVDLAASLPAVALATDPAGGDKGDFALGNRRLPSMIRRMPEPECILAIDLGSSGPKVSLVTADGRAIAVASDRIATHTTADGGSEQDPEAYWQSVTRLRPAGGRRLGVPVERILAVSCASQWSVTVAVDEHCRPLMPAIHWSDRAGRAYSSNSPRG